MERKRKINPAKYKVKTAKTDFVKKYYNLRPPPFEKIFHLAMDQA